MALVASKLHFSPNELIKSFSSMHNLIEPLTEFSGSMSQSFTFIDSFAFLSALPAVFVIDIPAVQSRLAVKQRA